MRSKKATINIFFSILYEITLIISTFIIPRLVLTSFGSNTNGITQAVSQFISYISLLTAGVGSVTLVALYKPVANKDIEETSAIVNATQKFLRNISRIFIVALFIFALIFPFFINEFDYLFTFTLVLILGIGTFANYYFGLTYRLILNADQKQYINRIIQITLLVLQTVIASLLIINNASIHVIQLISALIFLGNPLFIYFYVRKKYKIDSTIEPNYDSINQRWDAFGHQIANFVNNNTDLLLLTFLTNLKEVSVYSVYYLVFNGLRMTVLSMITGTEAAFGNMFAKKEYKSIEKNLRLYEFSLHFISIILYVSMALLITPFVGLYTKNIVDANYHRPIFGYLLSAVGFFIAVRIPYQAVTRAAGHFKQTRNGAIFESVLNIVLSIALVIPFGMNGLIIGTLVATIFRTIQYSIYSSEKLLDRSLMIIVKRYFISIVNIGLIILVINFIPIRDVNTYYDWVINGLIVTSVGFLITTIISVVFYFSEVVEMKNFVKRVFKRT